MESLPSATFDHHLGTAAVFDLCTTVGYRRPFDNGLGYVSWLEYGCLPMNRLGRIRRSPADARFTPMAVMTTRLLTSAPPIRTGLNNFGSISFISSMVIEDQEWPCVAESPAS